MASPTDIRPPFDHEKALAKVQAAEDAWNSKDPVRVSMAYTPDSRWRNRDEFFQGRPEIQQFLTHKWEKELGYRLMKELWAFNENRISVRFEYEWHNHAGQWFRTHGNEHWEFDDDGLMRHRDMSANDVSIDASELRYAKALPTASSPRGQDPEIHDHLCGPDPNWVKALEHDDDDTSLPRR